MACLPGPRPQGESMSKFEPGERRLYIDGELTPARSGREYSVINPATEEVAGTAADAGAEDADLALAAARRAFDETDWSRDHGVRLRRLRQLPEGLPELAPPPRQQISTQPRAPRRTP